MRTLSMWSGILMALALPSAVHACEPVVPLFQLLAGSNIAGSAALTGSVIWLLAAVAIKCGTFAALERQLPKGRAIWLMLVANVVSTIPGVLIALCAGSSTGIGTLLALAVIFTLGLIVERRMAGLPENKWWLPKTAGAMTLAFFAFVCAAYVLYFLAEMVLNGAGSYSGYWLFKFLFVTLVASTGIVISAVLEECIIARLSRPRTGPVSFFTSVLRANYLTLGVILLVAALAILPKRLQSPHFLSAWLDMLRSSIGLG